MFAILALLFFHVSATQSTERNCVSLEQYDSLTSPAVPTVLSFTCPDTKQHLCYIGTCHDNNPSHPQYTTLDAQWKHFLKQTHPENSVIIAEALANDDTYHYFTTRNQAIAVASDRGYAGWLAKKYGVRFVGGDLCHKAMIQQLLEEFPKEQVHYFCFAFAADFWTRYEEKPDLPSFILERVHYWTGDASITFDSLVKLHEQYTNRKFVRPERQFFVRLMTLTYHTNRIGRVLTYFSVPSKVLGIIYPLLRRSHQIRDTHTFNIIKEQWQAGKNIFVVYGALHAVALRDALQVLTQQK